VDTPQSGASFRRTGAEVHFALVRNGVALFGWPAQAGYIADARTDTINGTTAATASLGGSGGAGQSEENKGAAY
jgi:hypothetical protein